MLQYTPTQVHAWLLSETKYRLILRCCRFSSKASPAWRLWIGCPGKPGIKISKRKYVAPKRVEGRFERKCMLSWKSPVWRLERGCDVMLSEGVHFIYLFVLSGKHNSSWWEFSWNICVMQHHHYLNLPFSKALLNKEGLSHLMCSQHCQVRSGLGSLLWKPSFLAYRSFIL